MFKHSILLLLLVVVACLAVDTARPVPRPQHPQKMRGVESPCGLCQFFIGFVEDFVGQNRSVADITAVCRTLCYLSPDADMKGVCQGFVDYYVPFMVYYLIDTNNPGTRSAAQDGFIFNATPS